MILLALVGLVAALVLTWIVVMANAMRSSPGPFYGSGAIAAAWAADFVLWGAWYIG